MIVSTRNQVSGRENGESHDNYSDQAILATFVKSATRKRLNMWFMYSRLRPEFDRIEQELSRNNGSAITLP